MERDFYDRYYELEDSHWWFRGRRRIITQEARRLLGPGAGEHGGAELLDVGCGTGTMLQALGALGHARGTEMESAAVEFCRRRGLTEVQVAGTPPLPFADASLDLITILDVLEHVEDDAGLAADLRRMLRPGGHVIATVPAFPLLWGRQDDISHHKRRYVPATLRAALEGGGLRIERMSYFNTLLFPPIAAVRLFRRVRPAKGELTSDFEMTSEGPLNDMLSRVFAAEARWLRRRDLPVGVSLLAVASAATGA
ncbi:MAG TPA: class I SAM-dependent methyltransferase [Thermoleophilaceae bacterium]|nr:class I SAM-dependent methyltransferase [Thermoleophilaceae bacterium]